MPAEVTTTTDGPGQFCSAWGEPCTADGPHHVTTYVSVRLRDGLAPRRWHYCPDAAHLAYALAARYSTPTNPEVTR